jgi:outer membrane protein assembly factor BamB
MRCRLATALFVMLTAGAVLGADPSPDERLLTEHKMPTDGPGLLAFVRGLVLTDNIETRLKKLVKQLGDDDFDMREEATRLLIAAGAPARPFLREALKDPDAEVVGRARKCLEQIDSGLTSIVTSAAVRLLAVRKPDGAAEALLAYVPSAEDETVAEEVRLALSSLAMRDGKPEPALVAALTDKNAARRAAAGSALARANVAAERDAVRKLLQDAEPAVRLRVGLALAAREKDAIPALIALLDNPKFSLTDIGNVEDVLYRLAEDKAPLVAPGTDETSRKKYRDAWEGWWKEHGAKIDVARLEEAAKVRNFTTVVLLDKGMIVDLDAANKERWKIELGLVLPLDVQLLPGERVLIAEHDGGRVSERNRKGDVLWEKKLQQPLVAQRLPNGNTFVATRTQMMEFDREGKQVMTRFPENGETIMRAQRLRNGDTALVLTTGTGESRFVRLDDAGKEIKSIAVNIRTSGGRIDVLPNGHLLIPENTGNRVVELDADGKEVWQVKMDRPIMALRLPNGNTMVTSMNETLGAVEFDRTGKEVWQYKTEMPTRVTRAYRH